MSRAGTPPPGAKGPRGHGLRGLAVSRGEVIGLMILLAAVVFSAVGVAYSKHYSRLLFVELQGLQRQRDQLAEEWGQLLLEQSTWSTHARIEGEARDRLDMEAPRPDAVVMVNL